MYSHIFPPMITLIHKHKNVKLFHYDAPALSLCYTSDGHFFAPTPSCYSWMQENAEAFGGDPDRIMIFGCSAGGGSVSNHVAMPASKGTLTLNPYPRMPASKSAEIESYLLIFYNRSQFVWKTGYSFAHVRITSIGNRSLLFSVFTTCVLAI